MSRTDTLRLRYGTDDGSQQIRAQSNRKLFVLQHFSPTSSATVRAVNAAERLAAGGKPAGFSLQSAVPVLLFLAVNRLAGLRWAVVAATIWSVWLVVDRRRKGIPLGRFMPIVTAAVVIRGAIGAITESETLYFGLGIATKYVVAAVLIGSIIVRRPLAQFAAPYVMDIPPFMRSHRLFRSTMSIITALGALYYCLSASLDIWLFRRNSVEGFVFLRFVANWPLSAATIMAILVVAQLQLQKIPGVSSVSELVERKLAAHIPPQDPPPPPESPETSPHGS